MTKFELEQDKHGIKFYSSSNSHFCSVLIHFDGRLKPDGNGIVDRVNVNQIIKLIRSLHQKSDFKLYEREKLKI